MNTLKSSRNVKLLWKWLACSSRTSAVTSDFNHPRKDYINYVYRDLSAEMMSTENDAQNSVDRAVD